MGRSGAFVKKGGGRALVLSSSAVLIALACSVDDTDRVYGGSGGQSAGSGGVTSSAGTTASSGRGGVSQATSGAGGQGAMPPSTGNAGNAQSGGVGGESTDPSSGGMSGAAGATSQECEPSLVRACSEGGLVGPCSAGEQTCLEDSSWGPCSIAPQKQDGCAEGNDDNCNGTPNEGCACTAGTERACGESGALGNCAKGVQRCTPEGTWGTCSISAGAKDLCTSGDDSNCNGVANEGCPCVRGTQRSCSEAGALGPCAKGIQTCTNEDVWSSCSITPSSADTCAANNDANCNDKPNEGCACIEGATRRCSEAGLGGKCAGGIQTCTAKGTWGACSIAPAAADTCAEGNDDNCNGKVNEGCGCVSGATRTCDKAGLFGKCAAGTQKCSAAGAWGACSVTPSAADTCDQGNDDNCNGQTNEGCLCINGVTRRACGACEDGTQVCSNGKTNQYGACTGAVLSPTTYYRDADGDGFGSSATTTVCGGTRPAGYSDQTGDCCDDGGNLALAAKIHPGQAEFFETAANLCGITWNYNCSAGVETSPATRGTGCVSGTTFPTCATATMPLGEANCGKTTASCGCGKTSLETCTSGCGGAFVIKCH